MIGSRPLLLLAGFLCTLLIGAGAAYAYDQSTSDQIAKGVMIGGVSVGGMTSAQARAALDAKLAPAINTPVVVEAEGRRFSLSPKQAKLAIDVQASINEAVAASRDGSIVERTTRSISGGSLNESLTPELSYSTAAINRFVEQIRLKVNRKPKNASVDFTTTAVEPQKGNEGRQLKATALRAEIATAFASQVGSRNLTATVAHTKPKITRSTLAHKYPYLITVDRSTYQLRLFRDLKLVKTFMVAVGAPQYPTPTGLFYIQDKVVDPVWSVPNAPWAAELAGTTVAGGTAANPLKSRWMGIADGAGIHGTDNTGSLGSAASHGCVRMAVGDVIELYDEVPVGTPIYIV
ncbi:MAG: L,D-transpeptidase/peptidoglycan binding protein [Actinomycetota bacterium]